MQLAVHPGLPQHLPRPNGRILSGATFEALDVGFAFAAAATFEALDFGFAFAAAATFEALYFGFGSVAAAVGLKPFLMASRACKALCAAATASKGLVLLLILCSCEPCGISSSCSTVAAGAGCV